MRKATAGTGKGLHYQSFIPNVPKAVSPHRQNSVTVIWEPQGQDGLVLQMRSAGFQIRRDGLIGYQQV